MRRLLTMLLAALLLLGPVSCGSRTDAPAGGTDAPVSAPAATDDTGEETPAESPAGPAEEEMPAETTVPAEEETPAETTAEPSSAQPEESPGRTLVAVFSATGHTRGVAEKIAAITGADLYEIRAAQEYTEDDLNWNDGSSRTTAEQNDKSARPEIGGEPLSLDGYSTVFVGYPIWWGEEPRIMDTFVESCDFDGVTVIPFCTSGSSGIGSSGRNLAENAGSGAWLEGARFAADATEEEIRSWIDGLGLEERAETAMVLTIGDTEVPVTWEDNASVSALRELLPLTIPMSMYGGFEQVGSIGQTIPSDDTQITTESGDVMLYSGDRLVIFYGSNSWAYTRLGRVELSQQEMTELLGQGDVSVMLTMGS